MHSQPVLKLDESRLQYFDPQDPVVLGRIWSVFSKASSLLEDGERLRNLSWRLYSRETLCCTPQRRSVRSDSASTTASSRLSDSNATLSEPDLSRSVDSADSAVSDDAVMLDSKCSQPSERHITPADFQNLVHSIRHKQLLKPSPPPSRLTPRPRSSQPPSQDAAPCAFSPPPPNAESSTSTVATATDSFGSAAQASATSVSSDSSSRHSVVRGFTPGTGVTSYTSKTQLAPTPPAPAPILKKSPTATPPVAAAAAAAAGKKKAGIFMLGGSSGEDDESFRDRMSPPPARSSQRACDGSRKQTSFKDEVLVMHNRHSDQAGSDWESDSDSAAVESAIEDDEDEWEDDESEPKSDAGNKELKFYRVDSKANLTSRRSALTLNIEEQRSGRNTHSNSTPTLRRSRTSTPSGPSIPASPTEESALHMPSKTQAAKPIVTTSNMQPTPAVASPRTTRRHMLAGELSESLRRNMLSERQQKSSVHINAMRRANTAGDMSKLGRVAEAGEPAKVNVEGSSIPANVGGTRHNWNHYFDHSVGEYHQTGW